MAELGSSLEVVTRLGRRAAWMVESLQSAAVAAVTAGEKAGTLQVSAHCGVWKDSRTVRVTEQPTASVITARKGLQIGTRAPGHS